MSNTVTKSATCTDPTCDDSFPCVDCILAANPELAAEFTRTGALARGTVEDPTRPRPTGPGTGNGIRRPVTSTGRPATEKQMAFLTSLCDRTGTEVPTGLTTAEASAMIDVLKAQADRMPVPAADGDGELTARWVKNDGRWAVRTCRPATTGTPVVVVKASGDRQDKVLAAALDTSGLLFDVTDPAPQAPTGAPVDGLNINPLFDGIVTSSGEDRTDLWVAVPGGDTRLKLHLSRPRDGKWAGYVFVKDAAVYGEGRKYGTQRPGQAYHGQVEDELRAILNGAFWWGNYRSVVPLRRVPRRCTSLATSSRSFWCRSRMYFTAGCDMSTARAISRCPAPAKKASMIAASRSSRARLARTAARLSLLSTSGSIPETVGVVLRLSTSPSPMPPSTCASRVNSGMAGVRGRSWRGSAGTGWASTGALAAGPSW